MLSAFANDFFTKGHRKVTDERIPTGIPRFEEVLDGKGYYRGGSILVSGTAGTGKTSLATHLVVDRWT